jgi:DNA-binding response OmpR family regulator
MRNTIGDLVPGDAFLTDGVFGKGYIVSLASSRLMTQRIVVVEDETPVLEMLIEFLEADGFSVLGLEHPDQAEKFDEEQRPNLFIIDLMLPGKDGMEVAKKLRTEGFEDTPMIAMSASRALTESASDSGLFQETIYKPFDLSTLLACVERHLA